MSAEYFNVPALSASLAKQLIKSAAHAKWYLDNKSKTTPAMAFGTAVHAAILEPHRNDVFVVKRHSWTTKEGKEEREQLEETGLPILKQEDVDTIYRIRDAVLSVPVVRDALEVGAKEVGRYWEGRGVPCKGKADLVAGDTVFDIKTTTDATPRGFLSSVYKYQYGIQARHYLDGFDAADFIFVAVETEPPHAVGLYRLSDTLLIRASHDLDVCARRYADAMKTGNWPGLGDDVQLIG